MVRKAISHSTEIQYVCLAPASGFTVFHESVIRKGEDERHDAIILLGICLLGTYNRWTSRYSVQATTPIVLAERNLSVAQV
jgi:hypothetical protein